MLKWARETAGYPPAAAAKRVGVRERALLAAERGEALLTLRQAERAAAAYGRSLALLMGPAPPEEPSLEAKYRRLRGAPSLPWSPELIRLEREIRDQQDVTADLYATFGDRPPWQDACEMLQLPRLPEPAYVANLLSLEPFALRSPARDLWHSRKVVVRSVEWAGVLVIRWPVPDTGVRGFALPHPEVPAIYVNSSEDPRAQAFTIVHELAHLLLDGTGTRRDDEETWCEMYAGDVLMPRRTFEQANVEHGGSVPDVAWDFGVTPAAAAVRAAQLDLISWDQAEAILRRRAGRPDVGGGNGNRRKVARLSPTFTDLVLAAADSSTVTLATAAQLLRTRVEDFPKLREIADRELTYE